MDIIEVVAPPGKEDGPFIIDITFPRSCSMSRGTKRGGMINPRCGWVDLADKAGKELDIEFKLQYTEEGLRVGFYDADECRRVIERVDETWPDQLLKSLGYYVSLCCRWGDRRLVDWLAEGYGLDVQEILDFHADRLVQHSHNPPNPFL